MNILRKLCQNTISVYLFILIIFLLGTYRFLTLPVALYPDTAKPRFKVYINNPGYAGDTFRQKWGKELETLFKNIDKVDEVDTIYGYEWSEFKITFDWNVPSKWAKAQLQTAIKGVQLPANWQQHIYSQSQNGKIYLIISSPQHNAAALYQLFEPRILPRLQALKDFNNVGMHLPYQRQLEINIKPQRALAAKLSIEDIKNKIEAHRSDLSLGSLSSGPNKYLVVINNHSDDLKKIGQIILKKDQDKLTFLSDIAEIKYSQGDPDVIFRGEGHRGLFIDGEMSADGNMKRGGDNFEAIVAEEIKNLNDPNISYKVLLNPAYFIEDSINGVIEALLIGILSAIFILILFLGQWRSTLIISLTIPLSLLTGVIIMELLHIELNLVSLGGMALSAGMVVDGGIVVLENIYRHLQARPPNRLEAVINASKEVSGALLASLLTTIIVFVPLSFTAPLTRAILGDLAQVVVCVLSASLVFSLLIIPAISYGGWLKVKPEGKKTRLLDWASKAIDSACKGYLYILNLVLNKTVAANFVLVGIGVAFIFAIYLGKDLKREIMAKPDADKIWVGASFKQKFQDVKDLEDQLIIYEKRVEKLLQNQLLHHMSFTYKNYAFNILVTLPKGTQSTAVVKKLEDEFRSTPEAQVWVETWSPTALKIPEVPIVDLKVGGTNWKARLDQLQKIQSSIQSHEEINRVRTSPEPYKQKYLMLKPRSETIFYLDDHLRLQDLAKALQPRLSKQELVPFNLHGEDVKTYLRYGDSNLHNPQELLSLAFPIGEELMPLRRLVDLEYKEDYSDFFYRGGFLHAGLKTYPKEEHKYEIEEIRKKIHQDLMDDKDIRYDNIIFNDPEIELKDNLFSLLEVFIIAIILIFLLLQFQFASIKLTIIVLNALFLAAIGAFISLWIFDSTLSVQSILGLILLAGTSVNNSIIFVDFFQQLKGKDLKEKILQCAKLRFRPIVMTTLTTIVGMLPIAIAFGTGSKIIQPLGVAVSGGLFISTFLTLILTPLILFLSFKGEKEYN